MFYNGSSAAQYVPVRLEGVLETAVVSPRLLLLGESRDRAPQGCLITAVRPAVMSEKRRRSSLLQDLVNKRALEDEAPVCRLPIDHILLRNAEIESDRVRIPRAGS